PIVVDAVVRRDPRVGASTGLFYGLNTLGAVAGVFVATFVLFPTIGLRWTNAFGALLDVVVGALALTMVAPRLRAWQPAAGGVGDRAPASSEPAARARHGAAASDVPVPLALTLVVYAVVGFSALLYEVAWTRALAVVLGSSIYAFSSMLGAFLAGIGLGSLVFRRWIDTTRAPYALLG